MHGGAAAETEIPAGILRQLPGKVNTSFILRYSCTYWRSLDIFVNLNDQYGT